MKLSFESFRKDVPTYKKVFAVAWPAFIELFLSALFSAVDTIMVGDLGPAAIAAVGLTVQPFNLLISLFAAVNVGATTLVSWNIGAGDKDKASAVSRQAILINIIFGTVLSFAGVLSAEKVTAFMGGTGAAGAVEMAEDYMKIISAGIIFMAVNMSVTAVLRGAGNTRIPMIYNLVSNFVNVVLNYGLIYGNFGMPELGVSGAAAATTISRVVCAVFALAVIVRRSPQKKLTSKYMTAASQNEISSGGFAPPKKKSLFSLMFDVPISISLRDSWKPDVTTIKRMFSIGLPAAGEQLVIQSGLVLFARVVSGLGVEAYAAHLIGVNVNSMLFSVSQAFGVATTSLVGRSVGADDYPMAMKYTSITTRTAQVITVVMGIFLFIFSRQIASLYTDVPEVLDIVTPVFIFMGLIHFFQSVQMSTSGALRGSGDTMYPLYACICGIWVFRVSVAALFVNVFHWGLTGAWFAFFLDQSARTAVVALRYRTGKWKGMKKKKDAAATKQRG